MQTSRFQIGLIAVMAAGLGYTISSSRADGYPAGAAVGLGSNPLVSFGGSLAPDSAVDLTTVPGGTDLIVTDVVLHLTGENGCKMSGFARLVDDTGRNLGEFGLSRGELHQVAIVEPSGHFVSGLPLEAGRTLRMETGRHYDNCGVSYWQIRYTVSGYYAQP